MEGLPKLAEHQDALLSSFHEDHIQAVIRREPMEVRDKTLAEEDWGPLPRSGLLWPGSFQRDQLSL